MPPDGLPTRHLSFGVIQASSFPDVLFGVLPTNEAPVSLLDSVAIEAAHLSSLWNPSC